MNVDLAKTKLHVAYKYVNRDRTKLNLSVSLSAEVCTVFDLISEHTLISEHPPFCAGGDYCQST